MFKSDWRKRYQTRGIPELQQRARILVSGSVLGNRCATIVADQGGKN
ncbi:hypothetical protein RESH_05627 [Rhodopirellula europaea SH398]|uniref:Uncharacterized protein n=1 Tax=Rhodopirellula europaea SH398 TaxID=1263868 RepID=M5RX74_9BACT|nr:hypothetical protein RESH_05627 [Rhodopirellula europaea SH398]